MKIHMRMVALWKEPWTLLDPEDPESLPKLNDRKSGTNLAIVLLAKSLIFTFN